MSFEEGLLVAAQEMDGKAVVTQSPATIGFKTWFTGAGDQLSPSIVRGGGQRIKLQWDANEARGAKSIDLQFSEPIELHDGAAYYRPVENWGVDDLLNFAIVIPATTVQASGSGNCNKVASGQGYDIIVPADGDGGFEVDLTAVAPVPAPNGDGFWNVDYLTGVITPGEAGKSAFHLITVGVTAHYLRNIALGNPLGTFEIDAYKAEWVHPKWTLRVTVDKQSAGAGDFSGWLLCFRKTLT